MNSERRWNQSLQRAHEIEAQIQQQRDRRDSSTATREEFADPAADQECVWPDHETDARLGKLVIRTLIRDIIVMSMRTPAK
jgi:hypothetical protein